MGWSSSERSRSASARPQWRDVEGKGKGKSSWNEGSPSSSWKGPQNRQEEGKWEWRGTPNVVTKSPAKLQWAKATENKGICPWNQQRITKVEFNVSEISHDEVRTVRLRELRS